MLRQRSLRKRFGATCFMQGAQGYSACMPQKRSCIFIQQNPPRISVLKPTTIHSPLAVAPCCLAHSRGVSPNRLFCGLPPATRRRACLSVGNFLSRIVFVIRQKRSRILFRCHQKRSRILFRWHQKRSRILFRWHQKRSRIFFR